MELRKDPITRSWVVVGHPEQDKVPPEPCPLCPGSPYRSKVILSLPRGGPEQVTVIPHMRPVYRIEGDPDRSAEGIYDRMAPVGAHEIVIGAQDHSRWLADLSEEEIARVLEAYAERINDLKRDTRFKYVTAFMNRGALAGQEWPHPHSQITATTFIPRRVLYELRSAREWYKDHERCVFCDILRQEEKRGKRVLESIGEYVAFCPYAARVPYEIWIMPRRHNHQFESPAPGENRRQLAALLKRCLRRLDKVAMALHMVLHTAPNTLRNKGELSGYWKTIAGDYHWHFEILPIVESGSRSYTLKEVYFNGLLPEEAIERLRQVDPNS